MSLKMHNRPLIAMSGGVDSSVAALITLKDYPACAGAIMELCGGDNGEQIASAQSVANRLGIPFHILDMRKEFRDQVIQDFVDNYEKGYTPNPCICCNSKIKFGKFIDSAIGIGFDSVVTGHYAKIEERDGKFWLRKAKDLAKDQSYFLYTLNQQQLSRVQFPLGELSKDQVRGIAEGAGFSNARQRDSQDICFVEGSDYASVIFEHTGRDYPAGDFVTPEGQILGRHKGIIHYTIGQRRGLGLAVPESVYVHRIDVEGNRVIVGPEEALFGRHVQACNANWISGQAPEGPIRIKARVRYRQTEQWAWAEASGPDTMTVVFDEPQRAITPGQSVVLYDGDCVVGGGVIFS